MTMKRTTATSRRLRCGDLTFVGPLRGDKSNFRYKRCRCGSYKCPVCGPRKLRQVRRRIADVATEKQLRRFCTLTLDPARIPSGIPSIAYLRETWRKMRVYLQRYAGKSIRFIAVVELQKSEVAHLHVLVGTYLPQRWLSKSWERVGGGRIVDIRWVDVHRVAAYLSKYLTDLSLTLMPSNTRRFSSSRGIVLWLKKPGNPEWWLCKTPIEDLRKLAQRASNERWELGEAGMEVLAFFSAEFMLEAALESWTARRRHSILKLRHDARDSYITEC